MAEGILKKYVSDEHLELSVGSMGIHAMDGKNATANAIAVCAEHSISIDSHRSRPLIPEELKESSFIFVMEAVQIDFINIFFPQVSDRLFMLGAWPERKRKKMNIADPVGRSLNHYRKTFSLLEKKINLLLPDIVNRFNKLDKL